MTEFVEFFSGLTYTPNDVQENGTLVLRSSNVSNGEVVDADNIYVNPQVVNCENVKVGDIVVVVRNGSRSLIGKHAQIKAFMPNTVIGAFMTGIRSECPEFTNALLNTSRFEEEIAMNMGATINQITGYMFSKMEFKVPCLDEQKKIGEYFEKLDNLITLHQRECISFTARAGRLILTANKKRNTSSWEQRKAIDIADYSKGNGYSKGDLTDAGTPIILYGRLYTKYQFAISEVDTFAVPRNGAVYSQGNEVIVPASGETAEDIARASAVEKSGVLLGGDLNILRPFDFINPLFLALAISNGEPQKELAKKAQGKSVVHIHNTDIQEVTIAYPSRTEQDRIVSVFRQLDHLITLHQRQPFSHSTPDISLSVQLIHPFYTSSWEQRKAKEICSIGTGKSNTQDQVDDGKYPFYIRSDVPVRSNKYLYDCEAVITIGDGNIGKVFHYVNGKFDLHQRCYKMTDFKDIWGKYFFYYFSTKFYDRAMKMTAKATVDSVRLEMISEMDIKKPPQISEQKQIAEFFANLDNLITLHQRKGKAAVSGCSNDANNSKGVCCKARDFGYKCHKKDESK